MFKQAVIMAAGKGSRLKPLTNTTHKGLLYFKGMSLLERNIKFLSKYIPGIYITYGHKKEKLFSELSDLPVCGFINTKDKPSSWWLNNTPFSKIPNPVLILTCDILYEIDLNKLFKDYEKLGEPVCTIVPVKPVDGVDGDYLIFGENNEIFKLNRENKTDYYCSGIQIIRPLILNILNQKYKSFNEIWDILLRNKKLMYSNVRPKKWISIDTEENYKKALNEY